MRVLQIPGNEKLLDGPVVPTYPFEKTFEEACTEPFVVLHTSGSTGTPLLVIASCGSPQLNTLLGLPKSLTWTHGFFAAVDAMTWLPAPAGKTSSPANYYDKRMFNAMPAFHVSFGLLSWRVIFYLEDCIHLHPSRPEAPPPASFSPLPSKFERILGKGRSCCRSQLK